MKEISIIGAGLAGTLLTLYLAKRGYKLHVFDARPDLRVSQSHDGRSINLALSCRGITGLAGIGIMPEIEQLMVPMRARAIHDAQGQIKYQSFGRHHEEYINAVERNELNKLLLNEAEKYPHVRFSFNSKLSHLDLENKVMHFKTQHEEHLNVPYQYLIGADGVNSCVREQLSSHGLIKATRSFLSYGYKELSIGAPGQHELAHEYLHLWPRNAFLLLGNPNRDHSITGSLFLPHEGKNSFAQLDSEFKINAFFKEAFADAYAVMPNLLYEFSEHPTGNMSTIQCNSWHYQDQCLLLGDAAHGVVPFFGQGMNSAFEDCRILNTLLDKYEDDWAQVMPAFYQSRKPNTDAVAQMSMDNFQEIQSNIRDPQFNLKKQLEQLLMQRYPQQYISKHVLVMFTNTPYAEALKIGAQQKEFLNQICEKGTSLETVDWQLVDKLIQQQDKNLTYTMS
ncbi:FAD-dependent oxidoreductase [Legionella lytica]|uniref:FAD-dependent oxidoreductase n=1 Tax=Legionella lytica TaxID=96232 RepID=A0ABW8DA30_9GAMM